MLGSRGHHLGIALGFVLFFGPAGPAVAQSAPEPNDYADPETWLCLPGRDDACALDLTTTAVHADGSLEVEEWAAHPDAPVDCFYVYPTVSNDPTPNSDMRPGPGEMGVVRVQLARFASKCRTYAPMYRQTSLAGLRARLAGNPMGDDPDLAYSDVAGAWSHYLEHYNHGRGVVLIGHSQGTTMLTRLIANEIDGKPAQARLVSAFLIGNNVEVPQGGHVGGAFDHVPLCRSADEVGCVVTYMTFRSTLPPAQSFFGRGSRSGMVAGCTNPAALEGGGAELDAYFGGGAFGGDQDGWTDTGEVETEFVRTPGLVRAECVERDGYSYLEVVVQADPGDPRADDIPGDLVIAGQPSPVWGLHLIDVGLAMGDLLDLVDRQTAAYLDR
ncbi:MAG: DUF3089 domain-containing protein [Gemmatimonadetes bacterium]|nr:DUF3089 domain-containing protein [Gemmatimonadota bacterium]